jgi:hypothetical protein
MADDGQFQMSPELLLTMGFSNTQQGFGTGTDPGFHGTGMYQAKPYDVDAKAGHILGADAWQRQLSEGANAAGQRVGPQAQAAQMDTYQQGQWRNQQNSLAQALAAQANGDGPSLAQNQLRQATDRSMAQALAMQASQRGAGSHTAMRDISNQRAAIAQQANMDSANLRMAEQMQARNQLGQVLTGARGQDIALAGQQAQFQQQTSLANMDSQLKQRGLNDQLTQYYTTQGLSLAQAQQQAAMQLEQLRAQNALGYAQLQAEAYNNSAMRRQDKTKNIANAVGNVFSMGMRGG